jgi:hypothetical protein
MTINEFQLLTEEEQSELLLHESIFIGKLSFGSQTFVLFQLHSFYVEVSYKQYRKEISHITCYDNPDDVFLYIERLPLDGFEVKTLN